VPQTYYEVEVGDTLTFLTDDIQLVNGEVPEGAQLRKEYWHVDMLEEQQELTWTEDGFTVRFVQEGRYQINAAALIGNILYELPIQIVVGGGVSAAGQIIIDAVAEAFRKNAFPAAEETRFVLASLGNDAGICGAARLVLDA